MADTTPSGQYQLGKARIAQDSNIATAAQNYADVLRRKREQNNYGTLSYNYGRARDNAAWGASTRGFGKGGQSYNDSWGNYRQNANQAFGDFQLTRAANDYGSKMDSQAIDRNRVRGLEDLEVNEFERKANLAAQLRGVLY